MFASSFWVSIRNDGALLSCVPQRACVRAYGTRVKEGHGALEMDAWR
jgi:hypothetical protein